MRDKRNLHWSKVVGKEKYQDCADCADWYSGTQEEDRCSGSPDIGHSFSGLASTMESGKPGSDVELVYKLLSRREYDEWRLSGLDIVM
jgi:hypothetical protein